MTWWTRFNGSPATYISSIIMSAPSSMIIKEGGTLLPLHTNPFSPKMPSTSKNPLSILSCLLVVAVVLLSYPSHGRKTLGRRIPTSLYDGSPVFLWPLPRYLTNGNQTLSVDPNLALAVDGPGGSSSIVSDAFERYQDLIFKPWARSGSRESAAYDVSELTISVASDNETLQLGVDESYALYVGGGAGLSIVGGATIEANTVYGAIRGLETFSQLCIFNYDTKNVEVYNAPWYIQDEPRFAFRGLLLDTARHFLPVNVIKQVIDSMSYAKL